MSSSQLADQLLAAALSAREHAYCPYSNYAVGSALRLADGQTVTGCNVENASYGLSICAERSAIFAAALQGHDPLQVVAIAIVAGPEIESSFNTADALPCGACLQVLSEFAAPECQIICANIDGDEMEQPPRVYTLRELFPNGFSSD